jgi:hypothetical protein
MFHTAIDAILIGCVFALHHAQIWRWMAANPTGGLSPPHCPLCC